LRCLEIVKLNHLVVSNIKDEMREHLVENRQSKVVLAKNIVCAFASSGSLLTSTRGVGVILGIDRQNIWRGIDRRIVLDTIQNAFWLQEKKLSMTSILTKAVKKLVVDWWTSNTTIFPNYKDILFKRTGVNEYIEHQTHYLQILQVHFL
jgi:hypothetical protein